MASSSSPSPSPSPSPVQPSLYDVFLSFRGADTRTNFTGHLLAALNQQGFSTFHDETKLERGEDICFQLPRAISESRVSIVVFSKNYSASRWCLDELVKIMECNRDFKQIVLPIFYDVDPSDVRYQKGFYAEAFKKHEARFKGTSSMERVERWREALTQAANLFAWHLQNVVDRDESKLIKLVVNEVINRLDQLYCHVVDHPVGMDSRVQELKEMLKLESNDVTIVGIWGVSGIGKTTIAKAVFNSIRNMFEGSSFLADVSETIQKKRRVVTLQKQLLSNILRNDTHSLDNYHQGIDLIKKKLCHRRLLLVLDDVDDVQQLQMLGINRDLFCAGSKIIITTTTKSSLTSIQVDSIYSPEELNDDESLKLFSWKAFKRDHPEENYSELSQKAVDYAGGLPLALEVLGSFFSGRNEAEWDSGLRRLQRHPLDDIQGKLKISFESLDEKDQDLFLDIAFFFIGSDKDFIVKLLEDSECFPEIGIGELARRSLIRVEFNELRMHTLLREMAREIVYKESSKDPGKRSRLRGHEEVLEVLGDSVKKEAIEGLYLELPELNNEEINVVAFANMPNVRLLHLNHLCHLRGINLTISRKLKWLCWHGFPLACIPDDLYMENLVAIDLQYSRLKQIWKGPKRMHKLRFLNLSHSCCLTKTPDFSGLKNLEELLLNNCTNLVEVDYSIGCLDKLVILNMANCKRVRKFPSSIFMLTSLRNLNLSGCSLGESRGLISMFCRLLPHYQECVPLSAITIQGLSGLRQLVDLDLSWCNLSNVPSEIGNLMSLRNLNLSGNKFISIPSTFSNLPCLTKLDLVCCDKLEHLPALPKDLILVADNCLSLESESVGIQLGRIREMRCYGCPKLNYKKIERDIIRSFWNEIRTGLFFFCHTGEFPLDLDFYGSGSRLSFVVPDTIQKIRGWIVHVVDIYSDIYSDRYEVVNKTKGTKTHYPYEEEGDFIDEKATILIVENRQVGFMSDSCNIEGGDEMEFVFNDTVEKCGIRLMYEGDEKALELNDEM